MPAWYCCDALGVGSFSTCDLQYVFALQIGCVEPHSVQWIISNGAAIAAVISLYLSTLLMLPVMRQTQNSMRALLSGNIGRVFIWSALSAFAVAAFRMTCSITVSFQLLGQVFFYAKLATRGYFQLPATSSLIRFLRKQCGRLLGKFNDISCGHPILKRVFVRR